MIRRIGEHLVDNWKVYLPLAILLHLSLWYGRYYNQEARIARLEQSAGFER